MDIIRAESDRGCMTRLVPLLAMALAVSAQTWEDVERIVVVGDVHGSFDQFAEVLRRSNVIDAKNKWSGGKTHLVQLGDIPDRGPDTRRVMDLMMELEKEAEKAGGMVHALIGNHEAMNMYGDLRYTVPEEFAAFRTPTSVKVRDHFWKEHTDELKAKGQEAKATPEYRKKWEKQYPEGFFEHRAEFSPDGKYGKWIRGHDTVVRINDILFLHAGISPKYASMSISEINEGVRKELSDPKLSQDSLIVNPEGPLWYRGLAVDPEPSLAVHVEALLKQYKVNRIVVGHTPTGGMPVPRFGGKVILADVGLGIAFGSHVACLVFDKGEVLVVGAEPKATPTKR